MAISYPLLGKAIALRANQLGDAATAAELEAAYSGEDLDDIMEGVDVPYTALKTDILNVAAAIVAMIGNSSNELLRSAFRAEVPVESGGALPTSKGTKKFYGKFDGVFSASSGYPLKFTDKETVQRRLRNAGAFFKLHQNLYAIEGTTIIYVCSPNGGGVCSCQTTCSCRSGDAVIRGVAWSRGTEAALFDAKGDSLLPDQTALLWQNMVLANISQEKFFREAAAFYNGLAAQNARDIGLVFDPGAISEVVTTNKENRNA